MRIEIQTSIGAAEAYLDRPRSASNALLVLTHGAGGGIETSDLIAIRAAAVRSRIAVARIVQPYKVARRRTPANAEKQDAGWLEVITALRRRCGFADLPLIVGGRSNGARVACRTAVTSGAAGVVALAFPVHPPGKPENSRLPELDSAGVPTLVVQGDRDPFGTPPTADGREIVVIRGGDHSLKRDPAAVAAAVVDFVTVLVATQN